MKITGIRNVAATAIICFLLSAAVPPSRAQDPQAAPASEAENADALRKAAQNPVASLISVPIQENWNFGIEPGDRIQNVMNIQPVIPLKLGQNWNLIVRWITPVIYQPIGIPQESGPAFQAGVYGFGDMQPAFFLSPKKTKLFGASGRNCCCLRVTYGR